MNQAVVILNHQALDFLDMQRSVTKAANALDALEREFAAMRIAMQPPSTSMSALPHNGLYTL